MTIEGPAKLSAAVSVEAAAAARAGDPDRIGAALVALSETLRVFDGAQPGTSVDLTAFLRATK